MKKLGNWKAPRRARKPRNDYEEGGHEEARERREYRRGRWQRPRGRIDDFSPRSLKIQNARVQKLAIEGGLLPRNISRDSALPVAICQTRVAEERLLFRKARKRFQSAVKEGHCAFLVTVIHPEWLVPKDRLAAEIFRKARDWFSRRCRNLASRAEFEVLGVVDVAWNANKRVGEKSRWCVHVHALIVLRNLCQKEARQAIKRAIGKIDGKGLVGRPRDVAALSTATDVKRAGNYVSSKLMFECRQSRVAYVDKDGRRQSRKAKLPQSRALELLSVTSEIEPQSRLVLSRLRRTAKGIVSWPPSKAGS